MRPAPLKLFDKRRKSMATINSAILAIGPESNNQVTVTVLCQISFAPSDHQSQFRLDCTVFGSDLLRDDFLFSYESQLFSGFDAPTDHRFEKRVQRALLNEDRIGNDEVVGKLTLRNVTLNQVAKRNTTVVEVV
jgi:hypothetical protein